MQCSVFIATSADGYIATNEGAVDWLHSAGRQGANMDDNPDMGFADFIKSIDCMVMGRKCMEAIAAMQLTPEQWPYGDIPIYVLSKTVKQVPTSLRGKVEIYSGEIPALIKELEQKALQHAYIDGGATITSFLNLKLINDMVVTKAPVLLGEGIPLFGRLKHQVKLEQSSAVAFANDFVQVKYSLNYQ